MRAWLARLAFWRKPSATHEAHDEEPRGLVVEGPAPEMAPGDFVVCVPSKRGGTRQVLRVNEREERAAARARDEWKRRIAKGQRAELWDAPAGVPRRRA